MENSSKVILPVEYGQYVVDLTDNGRVIAVSERFTAFSGYTEDDIKNNTLTITGFLPEKDREDYARHIEMIQRGEIGSYLQHPFVKKDGTVIQVLCFGDDYTDENGRACSKITVCNVSKMVSYEKLYNSNLVELEALSSNIPGGAAIYEIVGDELILIKANEEYYHMFGYSSEEAHPSYGGKVFRRKEVVELVSAAADNIHNGHILDRDVLFTRQDGSPFWLRLRTKFIGSSDAGNYMICVVFMDITATKRAERELENQQERMRFIAENTDEIYYQYSVEDDTMSLSNCINRYSEEDNNIRNYLSQQKFKAFVHPDDLEKFLAKMTETSSKVTRGSFQFRTKAYDDDYTWYKAAYISVADEVGRISTIYGRIFNIENVQKLKSRIVSDKAEIERLSTTDQVTGLLTRKAFKEKVSKILNEGFEPKTSYAMVYSDINDFSYVNDYFGFDSGNQMLHDFAKSVQNTDIYMTGCRIYSDFFTVLVKAPSRDDIINTIKITNARFNNEQKLKYPASDLHISSGVYFLSDSNVDVTIAIDNADLARRSVKGVKEIPCGIYSDRMRKQRSHDQQIAAELKNALQTGQIELFLQPKFSLDTREIIGAEALSRWRNTDGSYKLPYEFIAVLEKVGYIVDLDMYIYETLLKTMNRWQRAGYKLFPVSINFSRNHASHKNFVDKLTALADFYKIEPSLIEIEITESSFMQDFNALYNDMKKLRDYGFKIDIDDFGMGYSSLSVLLNAPVDIVKVDKVFIDNIVSSPQARDYVNQICSLINLTKKAIIFEGVETEDQAQILASSGHKMAQGWLFDKAISIQDFEDKYLKTQKNA